MRSVCLKTIFGVTHCEVAFYSSKYVRRLFNNYAVQKLQKAQVLVKYKNIPGAPDNTTEMFIFSNN